MSVLLTSGRKAFDKHKMKVEKAKKKKKARALSALATGSTPPMSSADTTVWYWELDGVPTTIMYSQDRNEVWCNGYILETVSCFDDCPTIEGYIEFEIYLDQTESVHEGRIHRRLENQDFIHQLYVDGCPIMEHAAGGANRSVGGSYTVQTSERESEILSAIYGQGGLPDYYASVTAGRPPRYEDAFQQPYNSSDPSYEDDILKNMLNFNVNSDKKKFQ